MLKALLATLDEVDEELQVHYKPAPTGTTGFVLNLEGTPVGFLPNATAAENANKIIEFRNNNIALTKEVEALRPLKSQFEGLDANAARAALLKVAELEKKGVTKPDDVTNAIAAALEKFTTDVVAPLKTQLADEKTARSTADEKVAESKMRTQLGEKFLKMGGRAGALSFILSQAGESFEVVDGKTVARSNVFSTDNPGTPLSPAEWLTAASKNDETSFAFESSNGGGADHDGGGRPPIRAGVTKLVNPTPAQLGANMEGIASGKVVVVDSTEQQAIG